MVSKKYNHSSVLKLLFNNWRTFHSQQTYSSQKVISVLFIIPYGLLSTILKLFPFIFDFVIDGSV